MPGTPEGLPYTDCMGLLISPVSNSINLRIKSFAEVERRLQEDLKTVCECFCVCMCACGCLSFCVCVCVHICPCVCERERLARAESASRRRQGHTPCQIGLVPGDRISASCETASLPLSRRRGAAVSQKGSTPHLRVTLPRLTRPRIDCDPRGCHGN